MKPKHSYAWGVIIAMVALAAVVGHPARSPANDPDIEKDDRAPDLTTARSAALAWIDASWAGNSSILHRILIDDEAQRKFMAAPLRYSAALRTMEAAAVKAFGEPGRNVTGYPDGSAKAVEKQLQINEDGDLATVKLKDAMLPLQLRRIDGKWRADLSEALRNPRLPPNAAEAIDAVTTIVEGITAEIREGKFKTVEAAKSAFRERQMARVKK